MLRAALVLAALVAVALLFFLRQHTPAPASAPESRARDVDASPTSLPAARAQADAAFAPVATPPHALITLGWGNGPSQVGRRNDPESAGEGPMAIAAGRDGALFVLDQVNARVLRRDKSGRILSPIALRGEAAQDLRADAHGLTVLDRLGRKSITRYDEAGRDVAERPLAELGVVEPGGTTGLYDDGAGGLYVEESLQREGRRVLRPVGGGDPLPGRPSRDGRQLLAAAIVDREHGRFVVRGLEHDGAVRWETALGVERSLLSIILCDSDARGEVYVAVLRATRASGSHDLTDERMEVFRLRADGTIVARLDVAHPPSELESFRELTVAGEGLLWWMHPLPDGSGVVVDELRL